MLIRTIACYDCSYCSTAAATTSAGPRSLVGELGRSDDGFYRRNYIEGLFLSSGVIRSPDYTTELMIQTLEILRFEHGFRGYIHAKAVPGTSPELIDHLAISPIA